MRQHLILYPLLAQVLLTGLVWCRMYYTRIRLMRQRAIAPQDLARNGRAQQLLAEVAGPSENLVNLFEIPVLFYTAVVLIYVTALTSQITLMLASLFVALRWIHSLVHITYNQVMHRFIAYFVSTLVLWVLWLVLGYELLTQT